MDIISASPEPRIRLSKSRIQSGRQCQKLLWLEVHQREAASWGDVAQARLDDGTRFGELARELLGGAAVIKACRTEIDAALRQTQALLSQPSASMVFEPAFLYQHVVVRVDALRLDSDGDVLIEVKSTTQVSLSTSGTARSSSGYSAAQAVRSSRSCSVILIIALSMYVSMLTTGCSCWPTSLSKPRRCCRRFRMWSIRFKAC